MNFLIFCRAFPTSPRLINIARWLRQRLSKLSRRLCYVPASAKKVPPPRSQEVPGTREGTSARNKALLAAWALHYLHRTLAARISVASLIPRQESTNATARCVNLQGVRRVLVHFSKTDDSDPSRQAARKAKHKELPLLTGRYGKALEV